VRPALPAIPDRHVRGRRAETSRYKIPVQPAHRTTLLRLQPRNRANTRSLFPPLQELSPEPRPARSRFPGAIQPPSVERIPYQASETLQFLVPNQTPHDRFRAGMWRPHTQPRRSTGIESGSFLVAWEICKIIALWNRRLIRFPLPWPRIAPAGHSSHLPIQPPRAFLPSPRRDARNAGVRAQPASSRHPPA